MKKLTIILLFLFFSKIYYAQKFFDRKEDVLASLKLDKDVSNVSLVKSDNDEEMIVADNINTIYFSSTYTFNNDKLLVMIGHFYNYEHINNVIEFMNKKLVNEPTDKAAFKWVDYSNAFGNIQYYLFKNENDFLVLSNTLPSK